MALFSEMMDKDGERIAALVACRAFLAKMIEPAPGMPTSYHPVKALIDKIDAALAYGMIEPSSDEGSELCQNPIPGHS